MQQYTFDIKLFRKQRNLTQKDFSGQIGISRSYLATLETSNDDVGDNVLLKIEEVFGVDLTTFKSWYKESPAYLMKDIGGLAPMPEPEGAIEKRLIELLDKCQDEKSGLHARILELEKQLLIAEKSTKSRSGK